MCYYDQLPQSLQVELSQLNEDLISTLGEYDIFMHTAYDSGAADLTTELLADIKSFISGSKPITLTKCMNKLDETVKYVSELCESKMNYGNEYEKGYFTDRMSEINVFTTKYGDNGRCAFYYDVLIPVAGPDRLKKVKNFFAALEVQLDEYSTWDPSLTGRLAYANACADAYNEPQTQTLNIRQ